MWRCGIVLLLLLGCDDGPSADSDEFAAIIYPHDNPTTSAGIALGRKLFFETGLSADGTISCASCHRPELAFSDGLQVNKGLGGLKRARNTPGLSNIGYFHEQLFWDGRADNLEAQALHPVGTPHEMGGNWGEVIGKLRRQPAYLAGFAAAFGDIRIDSVVVGRALAQYQRTLVSRNSKYDRVERGEANYTAEEALGHAIFFDAADEPESEFAGMPRGECAHCHTPPHFTNQRFENNGLDEMVDLSGFKDPGRGAVSGQVYDNGRFRNPSLRNVALTTPYMHDGRFATLMEVVEHYNSGGHYAENRSANIRKLGMNRQEKLALVAFLGTLTDSTFVIEN